jgi:OOP family OmpA-OmpF porin
MPEREAALSTAASPSPVRTPDGAELEALRNLLFGAELGLLEDIRKRLDDPSCHARDVSTVIAEAVLLRSRGDGKLTVALEPVVEEIIKGALRRHPLEFTSVLFPLMGPAIRRSIAESFRGMLQGLHKTLENSFSWKGLRWRLEALRAGKAFSEIVLLHTLQYRVEQLFLIHSDTGLVLAHVQSGDAEGQGAAGQEADMVSAMLTAIQDFVRDCFHSGGREDLDSLQMGESTIFVEHSSKAYLACVVRGTPPMDFRNALRAALERITLEYADALAHYNGDSAPFEFARLHLEECLVTRMVDEAGKTLPLWVRALPPALVLALLVAVGAWRYEAHRQEQETLRQEQLAAHLRGEMERGIAALNSEPGIVVYDVRQAASPPWTIFCMQDELAVPIEGVLREQGLDPENFHIRRAPFVSYDASIVARRVENAIHPPESVRMEFDADSGALRLSGAAPTDWIQQSRRKLLALPGVKSLDMKSLEDPRAHRLHELVQMVESLSVEFPLGKSVPVPAEQAKLLKIVENLVELEALGKSMGVSVSVTIYGHTDSLGQERRNYELSQERANALAAMLYARGASIPLTTYGMGAKFAESSRQDRAGDQASRRIELKVHLAWLPGTSPELAGEHLPEARER